MASIRIFIDDISIVNKYIQVRNEASQRQVFKYYCAARCIQRHFRGYMTRQYLKTLIISATNIQKLWRGKLSRRHYNYLLQVKQAESLRNSYNQQATLIQKIWRGYMSRRMKFDYRQYREYIKKVDEINKNTFLDLQNHRMALLQAEKDECTREATLKRNQLLLTLHYMIRTELTPGVFSLPDSSELSEVEKIIASFKRPKRKKEQPAPEVEFIQRIGKPFPGPFFPYEEVIRRKNQKPREKEGI